MKRFHSVRRICSISLIIAMLISSNAFALTAKEVKSMPYSAVAYMEITFKCGCTRTGTGVMIAVNGLITAGHNLLCHNHNKTAKTIDMWFGYINKSNYHYRYTGNFNFRYYCDFSRGYSMEDDIGYVVFPKNIGNTTGWFATRFQNAYDFEQGGEYSHIFGYHNGKADSWWGIVEKQDNKHVHFSKYAPELGDGAPICLWDEGESYPRVRAVFTSGNSNYYFGRVLTENIYDDMRSDGIRFN